MENKEVTGIILAGGKSSRFGTDKALYLYKGKRMIDYVLEVISPVCDNILISTNKPDNFYYTGQKTVRDIFLNCGPLGGIHACLLKSENEHNIIVGCDMPALHSGLFRALLNNADGYDVVMPVHDGIHETMASYFNKESLPVIEEALRKKQHKVTDAIVPLHTFFMNVEKMPFFSDTLFTNINTKKEMNNLIRFGI
ncbi:MAG: molybdenum cofactor guanylyltransferase [Prolixibacteraceae bacterium]|nr:molybdenum cofactor guanylyltransferase [Prolixibacteraceae bacterium]